MPSLELRQAETMTVPNFLAAPFTSLSAGSAQREAGFVHGLDTDMLDVLVAARATTAYTHLRTQFNQRSVYKEYRTGVQEHFPPTGGFHFFSLPEDQTASACTSSKTQRHTKPSQPISRCSLEQTATLINIIIETGVRHQIRAGLSVLVYPLWRDRVYGSHVQKDAIHLHAHVMGFRHSVSTGRARQIRLVSPLPEIFHCMQPDKLGKGKAR